MVKKVFFTFSMCIMLCIIVLALAFCRLLAHCSLREVKKAKQAHPSLLISTAMTGPRQKLKQINFYSGEGRTNRNLFVSWSTKSVDVMKQCLAQATVTIN